MANKHGGGRQTTKNGLRFEQDVDLVTIIQNAGIKTTTVQKERTNSTYRTYDTNDILTGMITQKQHLYTYFLKPIGIDYQERISSQLLPDKVFINYINKTIYILEDKYQSTSGSVDKKLSGFEFEIYQYNKLFAGLGYSVKYIYILSDWFKRPKYRDLLEYMTLHNCEYYFNEVPLNAVGL